MSRKLKESIYTLNLLILISVMFIAMSLITGAWITSSYFEYKNRLIEIREQLYNNAREDLKKQVSFEATSIFYFKKNIINRLKSDTRKRVYDAFSLLDTFYKNNNKRLSKETIQNLTLESLRYQSYNNGRGYYFSTRLDGKVLLLTDKPELEGKNLFDIGDTNEKHVIQNLIALAKEKSEGFYEYTWSMPGSNYNNHKKLSYIKIFTPLNLIIGSGEYIEDVTKEAQEEVISRLILLGRENKQYFFAGQYNGVSLLGPNKGRNMLDATNHDTVKIVQQLIEAAKSGGGFVKYIKPPSTGVKSAAKISYVIGIPNWNWYIGTGVYTDLIEEKIDTQRIKLKEKITKQIATIIIIFIVSLIIIIRISFRLTGKIKHEFNVFNDYFELSAKEKTLINTSKLSLIEFKRLAQLTNSMITTERESEEKLSRSLSEKEILIKEIHHRVKNNLQIISSLIQLQSQYADNKETEAMLQETSTRIRSMGIIHEKIYQTKNLTEVQAEEYIHTIVDGLLYSYNINTEQIKVTKNIDNVTFDMDTAIPLGLIINELLTNSIKHAFPNNRKGTIHVSLKTFADRDEIIVADNGIGPPIQEEMHKRSRLGMQLINGLTQQLRAKLTIVSKNGTKTKLTIFKEVK